MIICFATAKKHKLQMQRGRGFESHGALQNYKIKKSVFSAADLQNHFQTSFYQKTEMSLVY